MANSDIINRILHGDCLEWADEIMTGSVDMILTDLPYGTVAGIGGNGKINHGMTGKTAWDIAIDPSKIFEISNRILRKNGKMLLFSQEPYTTRLITEAHPNVPFNYRMIWEKDHFANSLIAKKAPVSLYEDILVFAKKYDLEGVHPLREYFRNVMSFIGLSIGEINKRLGHRRAEHAFYVESTQHGLCTEPTYNELIRVFNIDSMDGFKTYKELEQEDTHSTFNLWEGGKYKSNILKYKKDYDGFHPTQKPVLLLEDLIKTFSDKGDTVVDLTAGSGSTAVACINTARNFICIEKEWDYCETAVKRIDKAKNSSQEVGS